MDFDENKWNRNKTVCIIFRNLIHQEFEKYPVNEMFFNTKHQHEMGSKIEGNNFFNCILKVLTSCINGLLCMCQHKGYAHNGKTFLLDIKLRILHLGE